MQEESARLSVLKDSSPSCETLSDPEVLRKYSFGRCVPKNLAAVSEKNYSRGRIKNESISCVKSEPLGSVTTVEMPSPSKMKQVSDGESEKAKNVLKSKAEFLSEAAILRSVLRPQGVPVPVDKVGIVREPQVIVRKFNIPMLCPSNSPKFTKLKERWKYQHDVVGLTNVNPTNPLHTIMKSKPVVSYSVASFVNDSLSPPTKGSTSSSPKFTSSILPKNHIVASNSLPVSSTGVLTSLPSTPTAVVRPVQMLPTPLPVAGSLEGGKFVVLKAVDVSDCASEVDSESETVAAANPRPQKVLAQGKTKDVQNGKIYLNPFAEVKQNTETVEEMETDQPDSPEDIVSDANTLHLEILSECGSRSIKCALTDTGDVVSNVSNASVPYHQGETVISMSAVNESDLSSQVKTFSIPHPDNPVTVIAVPVSSSSSVPQMFLNSQAVGIPTPATNVPRFVTTITNPIQQSNGSGQLRTFQLPPTTLTNGMQQKPISDKVKREVLYLKPLQSQSTSVSPSKLPRVVTGKGESEVVVVKSVQLQNGADNLKNTNLSLLTARQTIALQYQRDLIKEQEEIRIPRAVSFPARNAELLDTSCQTNLFSLLETGRFVEMSFTHDPKEMRVSGTTIPAPSVRVMNLKTTSKSSASVPPNKRDVPVDPSGRVVKDGGSPCSSAEPVNKKAKLDQAGASTGNIFKLLCSSSNTDNKQTVKNINEMPCSAKIQEHKSAHDMQSKLELSGIEAIVVDPNEILPNKTGKQREPVITKELLMELAYRDWQCCLTPDEEGNFPIHKAVLDENLYRVQRQGQVLRALRKSIDIQNAEKQTPLHLAVWLGCPKIVQVLLEFGSRPELVDHDGNSALHLAIEKTSNVECLETLLEGRDCRKFINQFNYSGYSPLHLCAFNGKCAEAIALVKHDADINLRDGKSGRTPLFHSVEARDSNMSRLLVQYGASASITNFSGQTPLLATNDMSMLGESAMASVVMSRNTLAQARDREDSNDSWKMFETEDR